MCDVNSPLSEEKRKRIFIIDVTVKEINMTTSHTIHVLDSQFGHKLFKNSYRLLFLNV